MLWRHEMEYLAGGQGDAAELAQGRDGRDDSGDEPEIFRIEQSQFRVEAGVGEEERQEEEYGEILHLLGEMADEIPFLRHHRAEHERAEDAVNTDHIGGNAAQIISSRKTTASTSFER